MSRTMKDSGIPWIGEIPEGWKVKRLKQESVFINGFAFDSEDFKVDEGVRVIRIGDIGLRADFESCVRAITNPYILTPYRIENGDILIAMSGATTGKCCIVDEVKEAYINQRVGIIRSNLCKIIYYSLQTPYFMEFVNLNNAGSAQPNISSKAIGEFPILLPPLAEQHLIAAFLDKKCSEIDSLIELQEQMIEELKAYKQSVITEAVTKGLNPAAPMRDSGIEWIGQIPEHWIYTKLKHLCSFHNGDRSKNYPCPDEFVDKGVPFYGADSLNDFIANVNYARFITEEKYNLMGGLKIIEGDILYTLRGSTGKNAIVQQPNGTTASSLMGIRRKDALTNAMYLLYWLHSQNEYIQRDICINGVAAPNLSAEDVKEFMLFLPPISEQQAIADYLDRKCGEIDELITIKQQKIDSLKEYKKSVIYEYVTGKREV